MFIHADNKPFDFLTIGSGGHFRGKNTCFVDSAKVVYIGKATSLKSQLRQYFAFGQGKNISAKKK